MSHIFIAHVEEDAGIAGEIAAGLEAAGYPTWYYEVDSIPGLDYLAQVGEAWDEPRLLSECPLCHEPLRFNPFIVDNRGRY